jgi:hypothetical protein
MKKLTFLWWRGLGSSWKRASRRRIGEEQVKEDEGGGRLN